ncbi:MAG: hypothetical protein MUF49_18155 [Oculatellaceae cyanobacterium Prado106]|nr:hypothetical protein [Oculatellaceae cyanobacterium Prado106]
MMILLEFGLVHAFSAVWIDDGVERSPMPKPSPNRPVQSRRSLAFRNGSPRVRLASGHRLARWQVRGVRRSPPVGLPAAMIQRILDYSGLLPLGEWMPDDEDPVDRS